MLDKILLFPYYLVLKIRHCMYDHGFILKSREAEVPTVCVGNIAVGGTGKTPHTEMILRILQKSDEWAYRNLAVLSRGYRRKSRGFQQVTVDGNAAFCGDEPLQMKKNFPAVTLAVDKDRIEGCSFLSNPSLLASSRKARRCANKDISPAELIVLDDAFQYRALKPTLSIVLTDYHHPLKKDALLPLGRLRDLPSRIGAADIVIVTKCPNYLEDFERERSVELLGLREYDPENCEASTTSHKRVKVFFSNIEYIAPHPVYESADQRYAYSKKLILFSGIADDTPLRKYLSDSYRIVRSISYPDHHRFTKADIHEIEAAVNANPTAAIATTEKDAQRVLDCKYVSDKLKERMFFVPIQARFCTEREEQLFEAALLDSIRL